jgi:hypothetical protein
MSPISPLSAPPDRLSLEPNLDFVVRDGGVIELTKAGFRRLAQAPSARRPSPAFFARAGQGCGWLKRPMMIDAIAKRTAAIKVTAIKDSIRLPPAQAAANAAVEQLNSMLKDAIGLEFGEDASS